MVTRLQHNKVKSIKVDFSDEAVTAFGGLALAERLALRAGLWRQLEQQVWCLGSPWRLPGCC